MTVLLSWDALLFNTCRNKSIAWDQREPRKIETELTDAITTTPASSGSLKGQDATITVPFRNLTRQGTTRAKRGLYVQNVSESDHLAAIWVILRSWVIRLSRFEAKAGCSIGVFWAAPNIEYWSTPTLTHVLRQGPYFSICSIPARSRKLMLHLYLMHFMSSGPMLGNKVLLSYVKLSFDTYMIYGIF